MREPYFWRDLPKGSRARAPATKLLLTPVSWVYSWAGQRRIDKAEPFDAGIPVICVGNLTLGGAGKTPVSADIRRRLAARGKRAATLSRGYGGKLDGPVRVDAKVHTFADVGDEPLMLAGSGEAWISKDRPAGAKAMREAGVQVVIMDDGHQNPGLKKSASLLVIDASSPWGNGFVFPKGPLREPIVRGLARADEVILMGDGDVPAKLSTFKGPILRGRLASLGRLDPGRYVAFAGIGKPERFFDALMKMEGVEISEAVPYADHHAFDDSDLKYLMALARDRDARLVTTEKDHVRLSGEMRMRVTPAKVEARIEDAAELDALLARVIGQAAGQ
jgi:tetraacyldisaccharide 4'-kinase